VRISGLFSKTFREVPAEADTPNHRLLLRAGFINQLSTGVYSYLPLGWRVLRKIERIIREEMDAVGAQEVNLSVLQPAELWETSGRARSMSDVLFHLHDRRDHEIILGPTHEEVMTSLAARYIQSYRDLPRNLYQIQVKFRDEPRPRAGLIRVREFLMKDAYSFDADEAALDVSYEKMMQAYNKIVERCGLDAITVEADSGAIGGKGSHEFIALAEAGDDTVIYCPACGYAANFEKAVSVKEEYEGGSARPLEPVATPGLKSIEEVAGFLKVPHLSTIKSVFYIADKKLIFVVIRGDLPVNEVKLKNQLHCSDLRLATEPEVTEAGIVAGFASPVGLKGVKVVADDSVTEGSNYIAGGNKVDTHLKNVNYGRDFTAAIVADIAGARAGDKCATCGQPLVETRGIELGHIFKLGTIYSEAFGANYLDEKGNLKPMVMGCYGLGPGRLMAAAVEQHHDDKGIIWPVAVAPYHVYLCALYREGSHVSEVADKIYTELTGAGIEVLFDDREAAPGVKFNDADLIGIPFRVTVSPRTLEQNGVELKERTEKDSVIVPLTEILTRLKSLL
jgi:prolyl-tRNA synthetase